MSNIKYITEKFPSPLRYPGGKSILSDFLIQILELNNIQGTYCEGYAGGAGAALNLLFKNKIERIILNDADIHIYSFWNSILNNNSEFIELLQNCQITIEEWYRQRNIYENPNDFNEIEVGFSTFFLNRSNRGGILPNAGPTGGIGQIGQYRIDARFNVKNLIPRIQKIGDNRDRIQFYNLDAIDFIDDIITTLNLDNTLLYLDPPYYNQGKNLYLNHYQDQDHSRLSDRVQELMNCYWLVSYDNVEQIRNLYNNFTNCEFDINYSVQSKRKGKEIIFFSPNLILPDNLEIKTRQYEIQCPIR